MHLAPIYRSSHCEMWDHTTPRPPPRTPCAVSVTKTEFCKDKLNITYDIDWAVLSRARRASTHQIDLSTNQATMCVFLCGWQLVGVCSWICPSTAFNTKKDNLTMGGCIRFSISLLKHSNLEQKWMMWTASSVQNRIQYILQHIMLVHGCKSNSDLKWIWHQSKY